MAVASGTRGLACRRIAAAGPPRARHRLGLLPPTPCHTRLPMPAAPLGALCRFGPGHPAAAAARAMCAPSTAPDAGQGARTPAEEAGTDADAVPSAVPVVEQEDEGEPDLPRVLWRAPSLEDEVANAEGVLNISACRTGFGLVSSLLGIAPFTPPTPFMAALLLATLQTRLAHILLVKQLRAHARRQVVEVVQESGSISTDVGDDLVVTLRHGGGVVRRLTLVTPGGSDDAEKPDIAEVLKKCKPFAYVEADAGGEAPDEEAAAAFEQLIASGRVISAEEVDITPFSKSFDPESAAEAEKLTQRLDKLTSAHLKQNEGRCAEPPASSVARLEKSAAMCGHIVFASGFLVLVGGSYQYNTVATEAEALHESN